VKMMTRTEDDRVARRRDELARDRGSRRVSSVIDVRPRLTARAVRDARNGAGPVGSSDPRYAYLARTYDEHGSVRPTCDENGIDLGA
jgi:hypothetical protein